MLEHRLEAEDYVIVINTHKEEIKRLKVQQTLHFSFFNYVSLLISIIFIGAEPDAAAPGIHQSAAGGIAQCQVKKSKFF